MLKGPHSSVGSASDVQSKKAASPTAQAFLFKQQFSTSMSSYFLYIDQHEKQRPRDASPSSSLHTYFVNGRHLCRVSRVIYKNIHFLKPYAHLQRFDVWIMAIYHRYISHWVLFAALRPMHDYFVFHNYGTEYDY